MKATPENTSHRLQRMRAGLALLAGQAVLAAGLSLRGASMEKNALWLGYSAGRLAVAGGLLAAGLLLAAAFLLAGRPGRRGPGAALAARLGQWPPQGWFALAVVLALSALAAAALAWLSLLESEARAALLVGLVGSEDQTYTLGAVLTRLQIPLLWAALALLQGTALVLGWAWPEQPLRRSGWAWAAVAAVLWLAAGFTLLHWLMLGLQWRGFAAVPGWYWQPHRNPFNVRDGLLLAGLVMLLALLAWLNRRQPGGRGGMAAIAVLAVAGIFLQLSFGWVDGRGLDALRQKYAASLHRSYAVLACDAETPLTAMLGEYETRYGRQKLFMSTKPPGVLLTYAAIARLSGQARPGVPVLDCLNRLTWVLAVVLPPLAMAVLFPLYTFARRLLRLSRPWLPPLLYLTLPGVLLIPLFLDQALYPLVFLGGALLVFAAIARQSIWLALGSGVYLYGAIFLSFSMLPLAALMLVALAASAWMQGRPVRWQTWLVLAAGLGLGFGLGYGLFAGAWGYDLAARFTSAMRQVNFDDYYFKVGNAGDYGQAVGLAQRAGQIGEALLANNLEFASSVGFGLYALFVLAGFRLVGRLLHRQGGLATAAGASLFLTFVAMNLYGQSRGEVARLWIFWTPAVALLGGGLLGEWMQRRPWVGYVFVGMQFLGVVMTYHFQDYIV